MSAYLNFFWLGENMQRLIKERLIIVQTTPAYKNLKATRTKWFDDPPYDGVGAVEDFIKELINDINFKIVHPTKDIKGDGICKLCLIIMNCQNQVYLLDHLAFYCNGITYEKRLIFFHAVKNKKGRGRVDRHTKVKEFQASVDGGSHHLASTSSSNDTSTTIAGTSEKNLIRNNHGSITPFLDRPMNSSLVKMLDSDFAMFFFTEGIAPNKADNFYLNRFFSNVPNFYGNSSTISRWNLSHSLLDEHDSRVNVEKEKLLLRDLFETIINDGWTDPSRHHHVLNILIHTINNTFWMKNIYPKTNSVTGEYQADEFYKIIEERGGPSKVVGLCTDNASVMRKTWRLLMEKYPGFLAYGCMPHVLNLLLKDIFKLDIFSEVKLKTTRITSWFSRHAADLAIFREVSVEKRGKVVALTSASKTRWAIEIKSTKSCIEAKAELKGTVVHSRWDNRKYNTKMQLKGQYIREIILDDDYWEKAELVVKILEPVADAIATLQSDYVSIGAGYHAFIEIDNYIGTFQHDLLCERLRVKLLEVVNSRRKFGITTWHVTAYMLDPRYAKDCTLSPREAFKMLFKIPMLEATEDQNDAVRNAYQNFKNSAFAVDWKDAWKDTEIYNKTAYQWWSFWGDDQEIKALKPIALKLFSLVVSASSAEGNWSDHGYLWTKRRNRTLPTTADKMLNIYSNGPIVDGFREKKTLEKRSLFLRGMKHCKQLCEFKHICFNDANFDETEFVGMHGDEIFEEDDVGERVHDDVGSNVEKEDDDDDNDKEEEKEQDTMLEIIREYVGDILQCPIDVPRGLREGSRVALFFYDENDKGWFEGTLKEVHKGKKKINNCTALFNDGVANFCATKETYGRDKLWILLPMMEAEAMTNDAM